MDERRHAVFLDRDGVLNRALVVAGRPFAPRRLADFEILPDAPAGTLRLHDAGFVLIVVSNQPDVGRGDLSADVLDAMHDRLRDRVTVDDIRVCTCVGDAPCRKPNPGLLLDAAADWDIDLAASYIVGDRWRDIGAGRAAGCGTIFIDRGYRESLRDTPDHVVRNFSGAVSWVLDHV